MRYNNELNVWNWWIEERKVGEKRGKEKRESNVEEFLVRS